MSPGAIRNHRGFTLIEVLVVLLLTSVALLALGAFSVSVIDTGTQSRERLTAVHLAEEVIEVWQHNPNDYYPSIASDCTISDGTSALSAGSSVTPHPTCTPATGPNVQFTFVISAAAVTAPKADNSGTIAFTALTATAAHPNTPVVKLVKVDWTHKGQAKSIYLTHLTR